MVWKTPIKRDSFTSSQTDHLGGRMMEPSRDQVTHLLKTGSEGKPIAIEKLMSVVSGFHSGGAAGQSDEAVVLRRHMVRQLTDKLVAITSEQGDAGWSMSAG
jgi:hypothetical protein